MFSFVERGSIKGVAQVKGGMLDGKILYLHRRDPKLHKEIPKGFFDKIDLDKSFGDDGSTFTYFPETRENFVDMVCISASTGAGKSTLVAQMAEKVKDIFDLQNDDITIVKKSEIVDKAFDALDPNYVYVNDDFLNEPPTIDDIVESGTPNGIKVLIFDDLDTISNLKLKKSFIAFQNTILQEARKSNIYSFICQHQLARGMDTKVILTEASYLVFFPTHLVSDLKYALERYADFSKSFIQKIKKSTSKWIMFHQHYPRFILTETECYVFDSDRENHIIDKESKEK